MGQDKGGLYYHDNPQVTICQNLLQQVCDQVYLSCRKDQWTNVFLDLPRIFDDPPGMGPMAGVLTAMRHHPKSAWLVVAVDLPFLRIETLQHLIAHRDQSSRATAFLTEGSDAEPPVLEPLCTIYEPESYATMLNFFNSGERSLKAALATMPVQKIAALNANDLTNVNTAKDRQAALAQLTQAPKK